MACIDLTLSDDEEAAQPRCVAEERKRPQPSLSSSSDVVIIDEDSTESKRQRVETAGTEDALGDDELAVVGETGKTALRDFPHPRDTCCVHPFVKGLKQENSARCPQCYCYACDDNALKCEFWGTGLRARDHCNSYESMYWDAVRKAARAGRKDLVKAEFDSNDPQLSTASLYSSSSSASKQKGRSRTGSVIDLWARHAATTTPANPQSNSRPAGGLTPSGFTPAAAAALGSQPGGAAMPATPNMAAAAALKTERQQQQTPEVPPKAPASSWLQRMLHPVRQQAPVQLLATLDLPFKTSKDLTVAELQRRLVPTGFYRGYTAKAPEWGEHICLDNITGSRYDSGKRKCVSEFLTLLPMLPPGGFPQQANNIRTWKITVISHDAKEKPLAVAVTVECNCRVSVLTAALKKQLGSSISRTESLLLASYNPTYRSWSWWKDDKMRLTDSAMNSDDSRYYAFKVPKDALPTEPSSGTGSGWVKQPLKLALVLHEKRVSRRVVETDSSAGDDSDDERPPPATRQAAVRFGLPQIVVMNPTWSTGGYEAEKHLRKAITEQLNLFCAPGVTPSVNSWNFTLNRYTAMDSWRSSHGPLAAAGDVIEYEYGCSAVGRLYVHWGDEPLCPPAGFDMKAFSTPPEVQDEAARQRLAETAKAVQDFVKHQKDLRILQELPRSVCNELRVACAATPPPTGHSFKYSNVKPLAAAVLSIIPQSSDSSNDSSGSGAGPSSSASAAAAAGAGTTNLASAAVAAAAACAGKSVKQYRPERLGVLRIEVYLFNRPGPYHRSVADSNCQAGSELRNVFNARLIQDPAGWRLLREIAELKQADVRGIKKLMDWVVSGERDAADQPAGLTVQMHPYQLQSLKFMQDAEKLDGGWRNLFWRWLPSLQQQPASAAAGPSSSAQHRTCGDGVWWSPILNTVSHDVPAAPWGGFLAEEMGLGKTVEVLGLVLSNPAPPSVTSGMIDADSGKIISRGTLVVCAVSLVGQWCQEAQKKLAGSLKMYPYHGQSRTRDPRRLATEYDLVVTTYATLASDWGKGSGTRNPLHKIKWHRVVFDEGHTVKNAAAGHSRACVALAAERRWICTGTPLSNDITDLLGQFTVLQMEPFSGKTWFTSFIKSPFLGYNGCLLPLVYTLRHTMIRHTKAQTISGQSVLALPEKAEELVPVVLSAHERSTYLEVYEKAAALWASVRHHHPSAINQRLLQITALLQPLKRICSGGALRRNTDLALPSNLNPRQAAVPPAAAATGAAAGGNAAAAAAAGGAGGNVTVQEDSTLHIPDSLECPVCLDSFETPVMTPCHHWFCKECILGVLSAANLCPLCRGEVDVAGLRAPGKNNEPTPVIAKKTKKRRRSSDNDADADGDSGSEEESEDADNNEPGSGGQQDAQDQVADPNVVQCESKLKALVAELRAMRAADSSSKALVFSQYSSTLEWLKIRLPQEGFSFRTITGSMAQQQRAKAIDAFQSDPPTTVFLLSMRSGAVGINLTAASHVFMLEPCLNPALEEQAIGRAWRMGQTRKVIVKKFYVKGSIEERTMDIRAKRQGHAAPISGASDGAGSSAAAATASTAADDEDPVLRTGKGRKSLVGASAIAGNLKADRQVLKIAELEILFKTPELESGDSGAGSSRAAAAAAVS